MGGLKGSDYSENHVLLPHWLLVAEFFTLNTVSHLEQQPWASYYLLVKLCGLLTVDGGSRTIEFIGYAVSDFPVLWKIQSSPFNLIFSNLLHQSMGSLLHCIKSNIFNNFCWVLFAAQVDPLQTFVNSSWAMWAVLAHFTSNSLVSAV